jgi:thiol-disulfide isomerase/thioredoxin
MFRIYIILLSAFLFCADYTVGQNPEIPNIPVQQLLERIDKQSDTIFVVNFWATWCVPCIKEIPEFNKIGSHYQNQPIKVIMASLDFPNQKETRLVPFLTANKVIHSVFLMITPRGGDWISEVDKNWSGAIPATVLVHGNSRVFHEGEMTYDEITSKITELTTP